MAGNTSNMDQFEAYFQRADVDRDGRVSGNEAVAFLQASNLPRQVLAQIWTYSDQNKVGYLGRSEFYNCLKLVTVAQSKQELTADLVKAALYGPASAKIPPPRIGPQATPNAGPSSVQSSGNPPSTQGIGISGSHGFLTQQSQINRMHRPPPPSSGFQSQPGFQAQGIPGTGSAVASRPPNSFHSLGGTTDGSQGRLFSQVSNRNIIPSATQGDIGLLAPSITQPKSPETTGVVQSASSKPNDAALLSSQVGKNNSRSPSATGNGFIANSEFGDVFSAAPSKPHNNPDAVTYSVANITAVSTGNLTSSSEQPTVKPKVVSQPSAIQAEQFQSTGKAYQHVPAQKSAAYPMAAGQSQSPWPKMTQSDIQKYRKVFVQVDTDRDGKITGEQARNLFFSWRLPRVTEYCPCLQNNEYFGYCPYQLPLLRPHLSLREVLKQVWDLSDQDNDSMLSLNEFCIALYLMERYREGRSLPATLPSSIIFDQTLLPSSGQPAAAYSNASWRPSPGFQQPPGAKNARPITSTGVGKPPRPVPQPDEPIQQKAKVPVLEKYLLDQLSTEEQDSLNKKFEEAKDAEKKVADLEKDISEAKQKVQFFHAKMQELILYKSRCDNRLNEISERVVADKREAASLANKYEEKYKQAGDVASKLTIEEATFRDIQEKKMELYRAIIKLDQDDAPGAQDRINQIQSELEELVKALNERCKLYGLRGKPTSLVELPFGWQPGIEAAAADWNEDWDKFEDEGFTYVKELTLEVENVPAPPKPKSALIREQIHSLDKKDIAKSPSNADDSSEPPISDERAHENESLQTHNSEQTAKSSPDSPSGSKTTVSPTKARDVNANGSPHAFDTQSELGSESIQSGEKRFDELGWGSFDNSSYDTVAAWDINPIDLKGAAHDHSEGSLFGPEEWGLNPIKTGSKTTKQGPFFDSVPSTPTQGPFFDSVPSTPKQGPFFDSVPSTPQYNFSSSPHVDNLFMRNNSPFADSVPSTPMYSSNTSPRKFGEGSEDRYSLDSFSRFDSFNIHDSGPFGSRELSRFDSMRSTRESADFDQGHFGQQESLTRFDSFRSTADSDYYNSGLFPPRDSFSRFDSMRSTRDSDYGQGFSSFDDGADPFGSGEPFRTSNESQTPRKESTDNWKAF
ncbi:calcium-binding EF hand family protein [Striga asiatica]|uniref:Calcium-binding EF hand family protein n=1 Tax=Striga asiatica TaxID=4170 RepID=A0A5A7PWK6_STRAF|nr:calcium-binding EF hand family protein [Striga asiatica]